MLQSRPNFVRPAGLHVALIMDGNARWADMRKKPRAAGYRAGANAVKKVVRAAPASGIGTLTLFALSSQSFDRPDDETYDILDLIKSYLLEDMDDIAERGVRIEIIGRRDRIDDDLLEMLEFAEKLTAAGTKLHLRLAIDYSARDAIVGAARRFHTTQAALSGGRDGFASLLNQAARPNGPGNVNGSAIERVPDVDLLIRCGGEQRLSDFLLWECAHAEIVFTKRLWPDFDSVALRRALIAHRSRQRRTAMLRAGPNKAAAG